MSERIPQKTIQHVRDKDDRLQNLVKSLHRRFLKKTKKKLTLKAFVAHIITGHDPLGGTSVTPDDIKSAEDWLHNKRVRTSNPPQHIGRTNRLIRDNTKNKKDKK